MAKQEIKAEPISLMGKIFRVFIFTVCLLLIWALYLILTPQDISDIDGHKEAGKPTRDLQHVLRLAVEGNYEVTLTELEINQLLENQVKSKQGGILGASASIRKILVRLKPGLAEVIVVREVFGRELTSSMYLQFEHNESDSGISTEVHMHRADLSKTSSLPKIGGRMGELGVPQGFLLAVLPDLEKVAEVLAPELEWGYSKMVRFKIEDKRLILDPRRPTKHVGGEDSPF